MGYTVEKKGGEMLRAFSPGFYRGARVRLGEKFHAEEGQTFNWAEPLGAVKVDAKGEGLLDKPIKDILPAIARQSDADLRALIDEELSGQNRKSLINALQDEQQNRIGREGAPDPLS